MYYIFAPLHLKHALIVFVCLIVSVSCWCHVVSIVCYMQWKQRKKTEPNSLYVYKADSDSYYSPDIDIWR